MVLEDILLVCVVVVVDMIIYGVLYVAGRNSCRFHFTTSKLPLGLHPYLYIHGDENERMLTVTEMEYGCSSLHQQLASIMVEDRDM